jgi:hypothetical protein
MKQGKDKLVLRYATKAYGGAEIQLHLCWLAAGWIYPASSQPTHDAYQMLYVHTIIS